MKFIKKLVFLKGNAEFLSELSSVIKEYINFYHKSLKMTAIEASKYSNTTKSV